MDLYCVLQAVVFLICTVQIILLQEYTIGMSVYTVRMIILFEWVESDLNIPIDMLNRFCSDVAFIPIICAV